MKFALSDDIDVDVLDSLFEESDFLGLSLRERARDVCLPGPTRPERLIADNPIEPRPDL